MYPVIRRCSGRILCLTLFKIILGCSPASTPLNGTPPGSLEAAVPGFYKKKEDDEPVFFPGSSKKKSSKKGSGGGGRTAGGDRRLSLRKSLSHSPEIFGQFARLSLAPPANLAELDSVLEQLRARHKLYQRLAEQELNSRLGGAQRATTNLDIPAIVVEATANIISLEEPSLGGPRPVLLFGEDVPSSITESGKVPESASKTFSLSSSLETESACCDWPQLSCSRSGGGSVPPSSSPVLTASVASSLSLLSLSSCEVVRPSTLLSTTPPLIPTNEESLVSQPLQSAISPVLPIENAPAGSPAVEADSSSVLPSSSPSVDGPLSQAVVLNGPLITPGDAKDTVEVFLCPSLVLSSPENGDSSSVVVDGADSCCMDTVSDCTPDAHPSFPASGSQTVKDASASPLSPSPRYRPSLSLDLGGKISPLMVGNGETSPLMSGNGETSPLMGGNSETSPFMGDNGETSPLMSDNGETSPLIGHNSKTSPLIGGNGETSPLMGNNGETSPLMSDNGETSSLMSDNGETSPLMGGNGETSPLMGGNGETSPLMGGNGETSPLVGNKSETSPLMGNNTETSPLMGNNSETSPLMGDNGETPPLMGGNGEPAKEILQEPASPLCSDPVLTQ